MSKYTTELRFICETEAGETESVGYSDVDDVIAAALPHIFDFDFPIFDENYRTTLETKIIRHYYTREIGLETYGLWKLKLQTKLNEIMPYYNKLYESELFTYNPLYDVDMTTTHIGRKTGENTNVDSRISERSNSGTSKNVEDETNTQRNKSITEGNRDVKTDGTETESNKTKTTGNKDIETDGTEVGANKAVTSGNRDVENTGSETNTGTSKNSATRDYQRDDAYSDTPQGTLNNVRNLNYLTNARNIVDTEMTNENGNTTGASATQNKQTENNQQTIDENNTTTSKSKQNETNDQTIDANKSSVTAHKQNETNQQTSQNDNTSLTQRNNERTDNFNETGKNQGTNIGSSKSTEDYVLHVMGKSAGVNYARMIKDFRDNLLNIDMDVIRELNDLFMLIW